ncbi:MAG: hypothetical protein HC846_04880 [Blastocatellia bacterium]|nr:hypothetical protein [Blastocatellia bacterium]
MLFFFLFLGMLMSMNGYSGKDAEPAILIFIIVPVIIGLLTAVFSFIVCNFSQRKWRWNAFVSALSSIIGFSIINGVVNIIVIIIAIGIAEAKRKGGV